MKPKIYQVHNAAHGTKLNRLHWGPLRAQIVRHRDVLDDAHDPGGSEELILEVWRLRSWHCKLSLWRVR